MKPFESGVMELKVDVSPIIRGTDREIYLTAYQSISLNDLFEDIDQCKLEFNILLNDLTIVTKKNTLNGGSSSEILAHDESHLSIYLTPDDTKDLKPGSYEGVLTVINTEDKIYKCLINIYIV